MIINTTHLDKEKKILIQSLVGDSISIWESLFVKRKGSHRMIINNLSENFNNYFKKYNDLLYANIELRKKGIIIRISANLESVSWIIPFYKLTIFNSTYFSIYADDNFIKFKKDKYYSINKKFIESLINEKAFYINKFSAI